MDAKVRSSCDADLSGTFNLLNSGILRTLMGAGSTIDLADLRKGKILIVDASAKEFGPSGLMLQTATKNVVQRKALELHATDDHGLLWIWGDEYPNVLNRYDTTFLQEGHSHKSMMIMLTQSLHSLYAAMNTERGKHFVDAMMSCVGTTVAHQVGDFKTAEWLAEKLGKYAETEVRLSSDQSVSTWDEMTGKSRYSSSVSSRYEWTVQPNLFMGAKGDSGGLRTGGPLNDYLADAYVISSEPFRGTGERYLKVAFSQRF